MTPDRITAQGPSGRGVAGEEYTCLMSVYAKEKPDRLRLALESVAGQTSRPAEVLLVEDGPLGAGLRSVIEGFDRANPGLLRRVVLDCNSGLWKALDVGVRECRTELIMRMDSDDWSAPGRAERQLLYVAEHPEVDCLGSFVAEFEGDLGNVVSHVVLPTEHDDIVEYSKKRNPFRHPTMLYRKSAVLEAGGYREMPFFEDYDLALRLISSGSTVHNLGEELVLMRVDDSFYRRRGEAAYLHHMVNFKRRAYERGDLSAAQLAASVIPHALVCMMPNRLRRAVYTVFLRKRDGGVG